MLCIAGKNNIAVSILEFSLKSIDISQIVALPNSDDTGIDTWQRSFRKAASILGVKIVRLEDTYGMKNLVFLSLEYNQIIKPELFQDARLYNIHFSLLPAYKGMYTAYWPIRNGEEKSGVTLHKLERGIDTGDIVAQKEYKIGENMTSREMYLMNITCGTQLVMQYFNSLMNDTVNYYPQSPIKSSYYSKKSIDYKNIKINFNQTAYDIKQQVQALVFREYQLPKFEGQAIVHAVIQNKKSQEKPGTLLGENDISITFSTIDYDITLFKDQLSHILSCCESGDYDKMEQFLQAGYGVNDQNEKGWTPLIVACYHGKQDLAELLLKYGADINMPNYKGTTPLMYAKAYSIKHHNFSIMEFLVSHGADVLKRDYFGMNVLEYAKKENSMDLSFLLDIKNQ